MSKYIFLALLYAATSFSMAQASEANQWKFTEPADMKKGYIVYKNTKLPSDVGGVVLREEPSIFGKNITTVIFFVWYMRKADIITVQYPVELTGNTKHGWVEVKYPVSGTITMFRTEQVTGWVFGEYLGYQPTSLYEKFTKPREYCTHIRRVLRREGPSVQTPHISVYRKKDSCRMMFGKKGNWLHMEHGWTYSELWYPKKK